MILWIICVASDLRCGWQLGGCPSKPPVHVSALEGETWLSARIFRARLSKSCLHLLRLRWVSSSKLTCVTCVWCATPSCRCELSDSACPASPGGTWSPGFYVYYLLHACWSRLHLPLLCCGLPPSSSDTGTRPSPHPLFFKCDGIRSMNSWIIHE